MAMTCVNLKSFDEMTNPDKEDRNSGGFDVKTINTLDF